MGITMNLGMAMNIILEKWCGTLSLVCLNVCVWPEKPHCATVDISQNCHDYPIWENTEGSMVQPSDYLRLVLILWWITELASLGNRQWATGFQIAHCLFAQTSACIFSGQWAMHVQLQQGQRNPLIGCCSALPRACIRLHLGNGRRTRLLPKLFPGRRFSSKLLHAQLAMGNTGV